MTDAGLISGGYVQTIVCIQPSPVRSTTIEPDPTVGPKCYWLQPERRSHTRPQKSSHPISDQRKRSSTAPANDFIHAPTFQPIAQPTSSRLSNASIFTQLSLTFTEGSTYGFPLSSRYAPTPKLIFLGLLSALNASVTPRIASRGPRGTLAQTELDRMAETVGEDLRGLAAVRAVRNMMGIDGEGRGNAGG
jgi:hypothetical protein